MVAHGDAVWRRISQRLLRAAMTTATEGWLGCRRKRRRVALGAKHRLWQPESLGGILPRTPCYLWHLWETSRTKADRLADGLPSPPIDCASRTILPIRQGFLLERRKRYTQASVFLNHQQRRKLECASSQLYSHRTDRQRKQSQTDT